MNNYLQTLSDDSKHIQERHVDFLSYLNHLLSSLRIFDQTLFLKSPDQLLSQIHIDKSSLRFMKAVGTLLGVIVSFLILASIFPKSPVIILFLASVIAGFIGWCIPEFYIQDRMKTHHFLLYQAVPTFLEQFHMLTSSAGYESFSQALKLIAPSFPGTLGEELRRLAKVQPFLSEKELLDRLTLICPHPLLKELIVSIRVSSQYGTSLTSKTANLVENAQQLREQQTKDIANKTSGVLLGPLLLFHLPALLMIFLIPFLFTLQKGF